MVQRVEHVDAELKCGRFGNPETLAERQIDCPVTRSPQPCFAHVTWTYGLPARPAERYGRKRGLIQVWSTASGDIDGRRMKIRITADIIGTLQFPGVAL